MPEHVGEWLNAYLDGELHGLRLHQVEQHLDSCHICQSELQSLQKLSRLLHSVPLPTAMPSAERFTSQLALCLPRRPPSSLRMTAFDIGWWLVPVVLLVILVFVQTVFLLSSTLWAVERAGVFDIGDWVAITPPEATWLTANLNRFGLVPQGSELELAQNTEAFIRIVLSQVTWQLAIGLVCLGWLVLWWLRGRQSDNGITDVK